jgi:hypothetical protein
MIIVLIVCLVLMVVFAAMLALSVAVERERTGKPPREILTEAFHRLLP